MARGRSRKGFFTRWWESKKDTQFQIVTYTTILSTASVLWGFIFIFMLGGASDPEHQQFMLPFSWLCLTLGALTSIYAVPEFSFYWSQRNILEDILSLDARTEIIRRRKEAEEAAELLGPKYQSRLMGLYDDFQIRGGKRFKVISLPPLNSRSSVTPLKKEKNEYEWWGTENSRLSERLPGLPLLRTKRANRASIVSSASAITLLSLNSILGLSVGLDGINHRTIDLSAYILSMDNTTFAPPHLDSASLLIMAFFAILLYLTRPFNNYYEGE